MARYATTVRTPLRPGEAFDYMADVSHFEEWDPGVLDSTPVAGTAPAIGAAYDVTVKVGPGTSTLRYTIVDFEPPLRLVVRAQNALLRSVDEVRVEPSPDGARVTYHADLTLRGPLRLLDPLLGLAFKGVGDRAAAGLRVALREPRPAR